jgi:hypothetical protein
MWDIANIDMLYADETALDLQDMKSPRELLADALSEKGVTPTDLGRMLGYKNPYHAVYALLQGRRKFSRKLQEKVADLLGYSRSHFEAPDLTAKRMAYVHRTFQEFLKTEIGTEIDEETRKTLRGIPFTTRLPTVALYQAIALAMKGAYTTHQLAELEQDLHLNEELDRRGNDEPPPDKPPSPPPRGRKAKPGKPK